MTQVRAPQVWALGYTGQGIMVGEPGHRLSMDAPRDQAALPGLERQRRPTTTTTGTTPSTRAAASAARTALEPCDDNSHGTIPWARRSATTAGNQIGVAPGAKWIGCRNMERGNGSRRLHECFQFFLRPPISTARTPNRRSPHVINNSWNALRARAAPRNAADDRREHPGRGDLRRGLDRRRGPDCMTVSDPPAIYEATFSTGAVSGADSACAFSSRGPVMVDGSGRIKPNIVAPGVNVRSPR